MGERKIEAESDPLAFELTIMEFSDGWRWGGGVSRVLLGPLAWGFGRMARARAEAYRRGYWETVRLPVPVLCVGNLTVGGSGKTPGVLWLIQTLLGWKRSCAVVTRGYGRPGGSQNPTVIVDPAREGVPPFDLVGDEPRLLARRGGIPVGVGADRAAVAEKLYELHHPAALVMDDGFQHFRLYRDRDLVCLDARWAHRVLVEKCPAPLLPAGPWREPPSALGRAHLLILTRAERLNPFQRVELLAWGDGRMPVVFAENSVTVLDEHGVPVARRHDERWLALSGLGDPRSFEESLADAGGDVAAIRYADHHRFTRNEIARAVDRARREERVLIVTEKDRERLPPDMNLWTARLDWKVDREEIWKPIIESVFS